MTCFGRRRAVCNPAAHLEDAHVELKRGRLSGELTHVIPTSYLEDPHKAVLPSAGGTNNNNTSAASGSDARARAGVHGNQPRPWLRPEWLSSQQQHPQQLQGSEAAAPAAAAEAEAARLAIDGTPPG
jgi:hypothetical protein